MPVGVLVFHRDPGIAATAIYMGCTYFILLPIFPTLLEITSSPPLNPVNCPVCSKMAFLLHPIVSQPGIPQHPIVSKVISRAASHDSLGWVSHLVALL